MMRILKTTDLKKYYGSGDAMVRALDGVNLSVEEGEFAAIVGTSGSGKSTLLHMMGGLDSLLSMVQMPSGVPVACVAINGAKNAAVLAAQILSVSDEALAEKLDAQRVEMAQQIAAKEARLQAELSC